MLHKMGHSPEYTAIHFEQDTNCIGFVAAATNGSGYCAVGPYGQGIDGVFATMDEAEAQLCLWHDQRQGADEFPDLRLFPVDASTR